MISGEESPIVITARPEQEEQPPIRLQVYIDPGLAIAVRKYARFSHRTQVEIVEDALRQFFSRGKDGASP